VSITGRVRDANTGDGLAGWVVRVIGPTTTSVTTDATGTYLFSNLVAGTYTVCEDVQPGWTQVFPTFAEPCASGKGYNFFVDQSDSFVDFQNMPPL
jgi:hypothetical protein